MTTYKSRTRDEAVADNYLATQMACKWCTKLTDTTELTTYGARCWACYSAYCREGQAPQYAQLTRDDKRAILEKLRSIGMPKNPKAWAYSLKEREEAGEVLSSVQRKAWRDALRFDGTIGDTAE